MFRLVEVIFFFRQSGAPLPLQTKSVKVESNNDGADSVLAVQVVKRHGWVDGHSRVYRRSFYTLEDRRFRKGKPAQT